MRETCKVVAAITVEGFAWFGQSPVVPAYVCAQSVIVPAAGPVICGTAGITAAVGKWATTPAGKELMSMAAEKGCTVVARGGEVLIVKGGKTADALKMTAGEAERNFRFVNTTEGMMWLMAAMRML